jgi:hypothetical protein
MINPFKFLKAPETNAPVAKEQGPPFVIDGAEGMLEGHKVFLRGVADELARRIPALSLHGVFGDMANHMTMRGGRPAIVEVKLGQKCGSGNCSSGQAGQQATVSAITDFLAQRPEIRAGAMKYLVLDNKNNVLAQN